jgi:hypothetical protein
MKLFSNLWDTLDFDPFPGPKLPLPRNFPGFADRSAPSHAAAISAIHNIDAILRPPRGTGHGYKHPNLNSALKFRLEDMQSVLHLFVKHGEWMEDSEEIACIRGRGQYYGRVLRHWIKSFIADSASLPVSAWGNGNVSRLDAEPELHDKLRDHLQSIGKYVKAQDLVDYLDRPEVKERYSPSISITLKTAQRWMERLGYSWTNTPAGCYVDGHERDDVVNYC